MYFRSRQVLAGIHVLTLAISTYIAAIEIETILVTAIICSVTGMALGIFSLIGKSNLLALAGFLTPVLAITMFILEAFFLELGPDKAARPFCIVFIIN